MGGKVLLAALPGRLPIELWHEIFLLHAPFVDPQYLCAFNEIIPSMVLESQVFRRRLLSTCRSFYHLVKEMLYTEVVLNGSSMTYKFMRQMSERRSKGGDWAGWTKRIFLYVSGEWGFDSSFQTCFDDSSTSRLVDVSIFTLCPNLNYLYLGMESQKSLTFSDWQLIQNPAYNLQRLSWNLSSLNLNALNAFCSLIPNLTHLDLSISFPDPWSVSDPPGQFFALVLPSLITLKINMVVYSGVLPPIQCPCLQQLSAKLTRSAQIPSLIYQYGSTIVELELLVPVKRKDKRFADLFNKCKKLKRLIVPIEALNISLESNIARYKSLKSLVLHMSSSTFSPSIESKIRFFSTNRFINLSSVIIYIEKIDRQDDLRLLRSVLSEVLPGIDPVVQIQEH